VNAKKIQHRIVILTGGQTGVDRAAIDAALASALPVGGYCPKGRMAEDGAIPKEYPLKECESRSPMHRTFLNVLESEAVLLCVLGELRGGTKYASGCARLLDRPQMVIDLSADSNIANVTAWLSCECISVLNIAGPRESENPGVYLLAFSYLTRLFCTL